MQTENPQPRRLGRSIGAVVLGIVVIVVLSLSMDGLMRVLGVFPSANEQMYGTGQFLLATAYRNAIGVFGAYLTARFAPRAPMAHALVLGAIGLVLSTLGVVAAIAMSMRPYWYPIGLVVTALPGAWLGGWLGEKSLP